MPIDYYEKVWHNGEFIAWENATVHVASHVLSYASCLFEGVRCYETQHGPAIFRLDDHMRRFEDSCRIYRMPLGYSAAELGRAAVDTVAENGLPHCYLRPVAIRTGERMTVMPGDTPVEVFIIPRTWGHYLGSDNNNQLRVALGSIHGLEQLPQDRHIADKGDLFKRFILTVIQQSTDREALAFTQFNFCLHSTNVQSRNREPGNTYTIRKVE